MSRVILLHPNDGCLTIARVLAGRGIEVHALATAEYAYVPTSRAATGRVMPDIRTHPQAWVDELTTTGSGMVICGSDAASEFVSRHRGVLPDALLTFESDDHVHLDLMDKLSMYRIAAEAGVRAPWMHHVTTRAELDAQLAELTYPCVLKPTLGHVAKQLVGVGTVRIDARRALVEHAGRLLDLGVSVLLTEMVPGPETALEGAVVVRDRDGEYPLEYGRRKLRQWPLDYGVGSLTVSADVPETIKMNRRLLDFTGYFGLAACESKRHAETGELYLIEVNVRVPGNFGLAQACGVDGPWRLYATLAEEPLGPQPRQINGRKVMLPHKEVRAAISRVRAREASVPDVLRSWRGTRDFGAFALRDPRPGVELLLRAARKQFPSRGR